MSFWSSLLMMRIDAFMTDEFIALPYGEMLFIDLIEDIYRFEPDFMRDIVRWEFKAE